MHMHIHMHAWICGVWQVESSQGLVGLSLAMGLCGRGVTCEHTRAASSTNRPMPKSRQSSLDWTGLDWTGLDWTGLDWTGLDWTGLDWTGLDWTGLDWTGQSPQSLYTQLRAAGTHHVWPTHADAAAVPQPEPRDTLI